MDLSCILRQVVQGNGSAMSNFQISTSYIKRIVHLRHNETSRTIYDLEAQTENVKLQIVQRQGSFNWSVQIFLNTWWGYKQPLAPTASFRSDKDWNASKKVIKKWEFLELAGQLTSYVYRPDATQNCGSHSNSQATSRHLANGQWTSTISCTRVCNSRQISIQRSKQSQANVT